MKEKLSIEFDDIIQMLKEKGSRSTEKKYRTHKDEIAQKHWKFFDQKEPKNLSEILYCMDNNIEELPKCFNGNHSYFRAFYCGYNKTCEQFKSCGCRTLLNSKTMKLICKNISNSGKTIYKYFSNN